MILKLSFRNFLKNLKLSIFLIIGTMISSALIVGALSVNDSIKMWNERKITENFGVADARIVRRGVLPFQQLPIPEYVISNVMKKGFISKILPAKETLGRVEKSGMFMDCLVLGVSSEKLSNFLGRKITLDKKEAIVSKSLSERMNLHVGDVFKIHFPFGSLSLVVGMIGEKGFLNYRGFGGETSGSIFLDEDLLKMMGPNVLYVSYNVELDRHPTVSKELESYDLKVMNMKYELLNSPGNQVLGYVLLAFSSFSIMSSVLIVYIFYSSLSYERMRTLATLKVLGFTRKGLTSVLLLEGLLYLIVSSVLGSILGIAIGKELLIMIKKSISSFLEGTMIYVDDIPYAISFRTFVTGFFVGVFLPFLILLFFSSKLAKKPAVNFLRGMFTGTENAKRKGSVNIILIITGVFLLFLKKDYLVLLGISLISLGLASIFKLLSLPLALFLIFFSIYTNTSGVYDLLSKGASFFIASFLLATGLIPIFRNLSKKRSSVTTLVGLSYVERFPKKSYMMGFIFGIIILLMTLLYTIPYNITNFVDDRLKEGLFGYDFMVFKNPLKLLDTRDLPVAKGLKKVSRVEVTQFVWKGKKRIVAFVDDNFLRDSIIPAEKEKTWRERLKEPGTILIGLYRETPIPDKIFGTLESFPFGKKLFTRFEVIGSYMIKDILVPVDLVSHIKNLPKGIRGVKVLLGKIEDPRIVSKLKNTYMASFDFPIYVKEEFLKIYRGIENAIFISLYLLYFGIISGLTALVIFTIRSVMSRKRIIGILKSMGVDSKKIFFIFLFENLTLVILGIVVGLLSGYLESSEVMEYIFNLLGSGRFSFPVFRVLLMVMSVLSLAFIAVGIPSFIASRYSPSENLREIE